MSVIPAAQQTLYASGTGRYDAFPVLAADGDRLLTLWRSGTAHANDKTATIRGASSSDGGKTWTQLGVVYDDGQPLVETGFTGLVWNPRRSRWQALTLIRRYADAGATNPNKYDMNIMESVDGKSWVLRGPAVIPQPASIWWWYSSLLTIDADGNLTALWYGQTPQGNMPTPWLIGGITSTDDGLTWGAPQIVRGPTDVHISEPQATRMSDGRWLVTVRGDDFRVRGGIIDSPANLDTLDLAELGLSGWSGQPSVGVAGDGTIVMLLRDQGSGGVHGRWAYATSKDGITWAVQPDFPEQSRNMMYGALATLPSGDVAVVYASEDDPAKQWQGSSVYHSRFVLVRLAVELDWSHAAPAALITTTVRGPVTRTWTTNLGDEITETVRIRSWDGTEQTTLDPEVQQGRTYTYALGDTTGEVTVPQLPSVAIVHPLYPEWGLRVVVVADEGRDLPLDVTITDVPSRQPFAGSFVAAPVVTTAGLRGSARGATTIRTSTLLDAERFERLIADGAPLFISGHVGIDLPDWVAVTGVKRDRFMGRCSCCLDDETDPAQWRHWSLSWVQVGRPSHLALPYRRRIRDYKQPINTMTLPIRET